MATRHEKLMYTVSLLDRVSGPSSKIGKGFDAMTQRFQRGMMGVASGAAVLFSSGYALRAVLQPSVEMDRALGEVRSLGVRESALKKLEQTALRFSVKYGESATDIVRSSYDIQSAIGGLTDNELARFTDRSALLAKATKSSAGTITDYMGTMYGVFKNQADAMGKSNWVDQLTNMTAAGVERFKTTGDKMSSAFSRLGSLASARGVGMAEQMAIMGTLQATMSGEESATKYTAFLSKVGQAQDTLGMKFTDNHGRMLPVVEILQKLRERFGDMDKTADLDLLGKAFGGKNGAAFVAALAKDIPGLADSIQALDAAAHTDKAARMAAAIADPWERLSKAGTAVRITFGRLLQPVLIPLVENLIKQQERLRALMDQYPHVTKLVGKLMLGVMGLIAAKSLLLITMFAFGPVVWLVVGAFKLLTVRITVLAAVTKLARTAMLWFNASIFANPITWIVLGVLALVTAIALLVFKFEAVKAAWKKYVVDPVSNSQWVNALFAGISAGIERIKQGWRGFWNLLKALNPATLIGKAFTWIVEKWNALPFVDKVELGNLTVGDMASESTAPAPVKSRVPTGGLMQQFNSQDNRRGNYVEKVEIHTSQQVNAWWLENNLATVGG